MGLIAYIKVSIEQKMIENSIEMASSVIFWNGLWWIEPSETTD